MNVLLQFFANMVLKTMTAGGALPDAGWKTFVGYGIAILVYVATQYLAVPIPDLPAQVAEIIGILLGTFGLGHKAGKQDAR